MKTSYDIDIGGTFTDCVVFTGDGRLHMAKELTTGYDLSVGFMRAIKSVADAIGTSVEDLLKETETVRYSSTIAMNTLIQRKGPKLALLTTEGFEDTIYIGKAAQWADGAKPREARNIARINKPIPLITRDMVVGIKERVDYKGNIVRPLDEEDARRKLDQLVGKGCQGFVVVLLFSHMNPAHEKRLAEIIREEYPEWYLGSVPVMLSSEVLPKHREYPRTMATILNAYLHHSMVEALRGLGDKLLDLGYKKPLMMVHNDGGTSEVFRTTALQTYNGGPVAGLIGSSYVGRVQGHRNVIVSDVGGTSFDVGLIIEGSTRSYAFQPIIDRWMVDATMLEITSIGAGGGSIARINRVAGSRLEVGPESAGSMPGPACYDLGGTEPTVTDADVVLGYINPSYYHGGKIRLNKDKAIQAIKEKIASPLQIDVVEAAYLIKDIVDGTMANVIFRETVLRGYDPKDFVLFAYGGAGPTHCCGYGFRAGVPKILVFPLSPVFCAFGSSTMDIVHVHEQSKRLTLLAPVTKAPFTDFDVFNSVVRELQQRTLKEFKLEGLSLEPVTFALDLQMKFGEQIHSLRINSPRLFVNSEADVLAIYEQFAKEYAAVYSSYGIYPEGGVDIESFTLRAAYPRPKPELPIYDFKGDIPPHDSMKGKRQVYWKDDGGFRETPCYEQRLLQCGNIIEGPAIIEAEDTTVVLPHATKLTINKYLHYEIERL